MWYISFRGEATPSGTNAPKYEYNILVYDDAGKAAASPNLLPTNGGSKVELRGFQIHNYMLYVVNAHTSQILLYEPNGTGGYELVAPNDGVFACMGKVNSIYHPFDLTFDNEGNCFVSSQDTNVVTVLQGAQEPGPVARFLVLLHPTSTFLDGTFVASSSGLIPSSSSPPTPPDVLLPQGLDYSSSHAVRGVVFHDSCLYVADEVANAVKVYDGTSGALLGQIAGGNLNMPDHLLLNDDVLYIGSTGTSSDTSTVVRYDLSNGAPKGTVAPTMFIAGLTDVSGMDFDGDGFFYAAERSNKQIMKFTSAGKPAGTFIPAGTDGTDGLPDEPEFILHVPN